MSVTKISVSDSEKVTSILASLVTHGLSEDDQKRFFDDLNERKGDMDVVVNINGFDVDSKLFFRHMESVYDDHVHRSAHNLLERKVRCGISRSIWWKPCGNFWG